MDNGWFKLWFAFCAVLGLTVLGVGIWAVISVVTWVIAHA